MKKYQNTMWKKITKMYQIKQKKLKKYNNWITKSTKNHKICQKEHLEAPKIQKKCLQLPNGPLLIVVVGRSNRRNSSSTLNILWSK